MMLPSQVTTRYYKKALMAVCLCIAVFAGGGAFCGPAGGQGSEVGGQRLEVGGQRLEVGGQRSEVRSQRSEVRGQKFCEESLPGTTSIEERFECFDDFIVHLKDAREPVCCDEHDTGRKDRILSCDVVIELNRGMKLSKERVELRKIIYKTLKKLSGLPEIRMGLKEEIKVRLNNFMDDEIIKNVYFTRFVLL